MQTALAIAGAVLPLLYLAVVLDYAATFLLRRRERGRSLALWGVVAAHAVYFVARFLAGRGLPVAHSWELLSALALTVAAVYGVLELVGRERRTGVFVLLLAFLFQYASSMATRLGPAPGASLSPSEESLWGGVHVLAALVAYTAVALGGVYGLLYLSARRQLRARRFGVLFDRLPPLEGLGRMTWHAVVVGVVCMTIVIAASPLMVAAGPAGQGMTPKLLVKIVTGLVAWGLYATAVVGHWKRGWSLRRVAVVAVAGFVLAAVLLVASGLLDSAG